METSHPQPSFYSESNSVNNPNHWKNSLIITYPKTKVSASWSCTVRKREWVGTASILVRKRAMLSTHFYVKCPPRSLHHTHSTCTLHFLLSSSSFSLNKPLLPPSKSSVYKYYLGTPRFFQAHNFSCFLKFRARGLVVRANTTLVYQTRRRWFDSHHHWIFLYLRIIDYAIPTSFVWNTFFLTQYLPG